jgi:hypothetical protein
MKLVQSIEKYLFKKIPCTDTLAIERTLIILILKWTEAGKKRDNKQKKKASFPVARDQNPCYLQMGCKCMGKNKISKTAKIATRE